MGAAALDLARIMEYAHKQAQRPAAERERRGALDVCRRARPAGQRALRPTLERVLPHSSLPFCGETQSLCCIRQCSRPREVCGKRTEDWPGSGEGACLAQRLKPREGMCREWRERRAVVRRREDCNEACS